MPVHTIAYIDRAFEDKSFEHDSYDEEDNNFKGLNLTAGALLSNTVIVPNVEEAEQAFKQEFGDASRRPRKVMLKGYSDAVHCRFKPFLDLSYELRQKIWDSAMRAESYTYTFYGYHRSFHLQD
ncbi:hypothetical protein E8E11_008151 [Didymella keratinophila]|nr:hypothetical protein E8E11_008151 [Didymella keratinophila]